MKYFATLALVGLLAPVGGGMALAADPAGDWNGAINTPAGSLRLVVHIVKNPDGSYRGALDSPDQGAAGIGLDSVTEKDGALVFTLMEIDARYEGKWDAAANTWVGTFHQFGRPLPLTLVKGNVAAAVFAAKGIGADFDGKWTGMVNAGGMDLTMVFSIKTTETGTTASLDINEQNAHGIPVTAISREGGKIRLEMRGISMSYEGRLGPDRKTLDGYMAQGATTHALNLKQGR